MKQCSQGAPYLAPQITSIDLLPEAGFAVSTEDSISDWKDGNNNWGDFEEAPSL